MVTIYYTNQWRSLFRRLAGGRTVAVLVAYVDESGHSSESRIVAMGGLISSVPHWQEFTDGWQAMLQRHGNVTLHMADLESFHGEFKDWNTERRKALLADVMKCLHDHVYLAFGAAVIVEQYRTWPTEIGEALVDPWFMCFQMSV